MTPTAANNLPLFDPGPPLSVQIRADGDGPVLAREPVERSDFAEMVSEAWRETCLRHGQPDATLAGTPMRLEPAFEPGSGRCCTSFRMEVTRPDGQVKHHDFTNRGLRHVADRAVDSLVAANVLKLGQSYVFEVERSCEPGHPVPAAGLAMRVSVRTPPLAHLNMSLVSLVKRATPMALPDGGAFPVFYTQSAFAKAEACARRGAQCDPPVESGGVLFGSLVACPESGEYGAVVHDVIEVEEAEETRLSLSYSSRSWMRVEAIQKARQAACPGRAERIIGQCHGHSFLPHAGQVCAECSKRAACSLTSVYVSQADETWHRAVFARQPFALCHIFGLTARAEPVHSLFGLSDGRLQARGFYVLPDFPLA
jgi:hypothetical protein